MARKFVVLCENDLKKIMTEENVAAPEADPAPVIAGHVLGTYASAKIAGQAIINFRCSGKHFIVEATKFRRLAL